MPSIIINTACIHISLPFFFPHRKRLFSMINDLPTVFEVVTERKPIKDKPSVDSGSKSRVSTKVRWIKLDM